MANSIFVEKNRDWILEKRFRVSGFLVAYKHLGHFRQANRWNQLFPSGTAPTAREEHTAVWSDVADGMYVFGGVVAAGGRGLSVNGSRAAERAAHHGFAEVRVCSMTSTSTTARRREEELVGFCLGGLMRYDDLKIFE